MAAAAASVLLVVTGVAYAASRWGGTDPGPVPVTTPTGSPEPTEQTQDEQPTAPGTGRTAPAAPESSRPVVHDQPTVGPDRDATHEPAEDDDEQSDNDDADGSTGSPEDQQEDRSESDDDSVETTDAPDVDATPDADDPTGTPSPGPDDGGSPE